MKKSRLQNIVSEEIERVIEQEIGLHAISLLEGNMDVSSLNLHRTSTGFMDREKVVGYRWKDFQKNYLKLNPKYRIANANDRVYGYKLGDGDAHWMYDPSSSEVYLDDKMTARKVMTGKADKKIFEGKINEARLARGLKPLLTLGSKVSWNTMSEDALLDLSDRFDKIDDEVGEDVVSYLNMSIENKQDGKQGLATKALKAFNKACKDALKGKPVKSVFEGKLTEAPQVAPQKRMEFGVEYRDSKGKPKKDNPLIKRFKNKAQADKFAKKGNQIDKVGGKYTVVQVPIQESADQSHKLTEAVSPKEGARRLVDKLVQTKLLDKKNEKKAIALLTYLMARGVHEGKLNEGANAARWFGNLKYYYEKGLKSPDLRDPADKKAYIKLAKQFFSKLKEGLLDEAVKLDKGDTIGTSLRYTFDKKGHDIAMKWLKKNKVRNVLNTLKDKYSDSAIINIDGRKYTLYAHYGQLRIGGGGKLGNTWRKGDEVDLLKQMQENKHVWIKPITEATSLWKMFDAKMKLQDEIMDLEYDMKMDTKAIRQLHKDMEQEAEPEGGKVADKYGKQIDKLEKSYKKKKSEFKKLMAKLDKMEQY